MKYLAPKDVLKKSYLKQKLTKEEFEHFKNSLNELKTYTNENESEEYNKNLITNFFKKIGYSKNYQINTARRVDLAIYKNDIPEVLIETKSLKNKIEMISIDNLNKKAFYEIILYYLRETIKEKNYNIRHLIITNNLEWFIFDATEIEKIASIKKIQKFYRDFEIDKTSAKQKTSDFYTFLNVFFKEDKEILENLKFVYFTLNKKNSDTELKHIYKLLSPIHLLKNYHQNDANSLNKDFYYELLHILGLEEIKNSAKKIIKRKSKKYREYGSLIENTILKLQTEHDIEDEEKLFEIALELNITWLNRILFLKLLEAKLIRVHNGDYPKFLHFSITDNFDKLNTLFFEVLAKKLDDRESIKIEQYKRVPYLNSSLFEPTELERSYLRISNLKDNVTLKKYQRTVLKDEPQELNTLEYLLKFLDAYDFGSNEKDEFKNDYTSLINSSVLGLIFEKLNGYKDGSFFTPSFITMYMTREAIRKIVIDKFNKTFNWNCKTIDDIYNKDYDLKEANEIINSITICDPAVGSGHFLVSALNELLAIKSELGILCDETGKRLKNIKITIENDEIYILDEDGEVFEYVLKDGYKISQEKLRIQKTIFNEKLHIIENQLFGVDINPNSVKITRLRLWIELLKDSYYKNGKLTTLPNIDINIKCGNSLISRFPLNDKETKNRLLKDKLNEYKDYVKLYKDTNDKSIKREITAKIEEIKKSFSQKLKDGSPLVEELKKLLNGDGKNKKGYIEQFGFKGLNEDIILTFAKQEYCILYARFGEDFNPNSTSLFGENIKLTQKEKKEFKIRQEKELKKIISKYEAIREFEDSKIYKNSFEWRFEFPEVLDDDGEFVGFDIVIGNPPYLSNKDIPKDYKKVYEKIYGFSDDLYNYFFVKGFEILKKDGLLSFITSNTFMTINSKKNLRELLQSKRLIEFMPIKNPFEEAVVEPIIVFVKNCDTKEDYEFDYIDLRKQKFNPAKNRYKANILIYQNTPNRVFFTPTKLNMKIYSKYMEKVKELLDEYWDKISTSKNIAKNRKALEVYRDSLKAGDITLLGLVTDGGQGLATANNGKYIGVKEGTKEAIRIIETRKQKIEAFNKKYGKDIKIDNLSEFKIRELFDSLKLEYGRDIFGQGYIYRIVSQDEIADVEELSDEEKANGISGSKTFVPYDKGDRDGNKWYYETPFYIDWNKENVEYLKKDKRARFQGYGFYFKEGFSWSDIHTIDIKSRLKSNGVYDVKSMSLFSISRFFSDKLFIAILNSTFISEYVFSFVNNTQTFQINDARQIPIIVPTKEQLKEFESIFDKAKEIKIKEFSSQITKEEAKKKLDSIQKVVDKMVYELYELSKEEIEIIENIS